MVTGLPLVLVGVCVAVLAGQTNAYRYCAYSSWGRKDDTPIVSAEYVAAHQRKGVIVLGLAGCQLIGAEVIACDEIEKPVVSFADHGKAVIWRDFAEQRADVVILRHCIPFIYHPTAKEDKHLMMDMHQDVMNAYPKVPGFREQF